MQSDPSPQNLKIIFSGAHFNQCRAPINATFGQPCNLSLHWYGLKAGPYQENATKIDRRGGVVEK